MRVWRALASRRKLSETFFDQLCRAQQRARLGLREAPRLFGEYLAEILTNKLGAQGTKTDSQIFWGPGDVYLAVHADDIVAAGTPGSIEEISC